LIESLLRCSMRINCGTSVERQKGIENASQNILRGGQRT
jgi:hypothetical protein